MKLQYTAPRTISIPVLPTQCLLEGSFSGTETSGGNEDTTGSSIGLGGDDNGVDDGMNGSRSSGIFDEW